MRGFTSKRNLQLTFLSNRPMNGNNRKRVYRHGVPKAKKRLGMPCGCYLYSLKATLLDLCCRAHPAHISHPEQARPWAGQMKFSRECETGTPSKGAGGDGVV